MKPKKIIPFLLLATVSCERADEYGFLTYNGYDLIMNKEYLPFSVFYLQGTPATHQIDNGVKYVNESFGMKVFLAPSLWEFPEPKYAPRGTVFIAGVDELEEDKELAATKYNLEEGGVIESTNIDILLGLSEEIYSYVVPHELGHVIGLAHDGNSCSVMYPTLDGGNFCSWKERKFTEHDIELVRKELNGPPGEPH